MLEQAGSFSDIFNTSYFGERIHSIREPLHIVRHHANGSLGVITQSEYQLFCASASLPITHLNTLPPIYPEWLGDKYFLQQHRIRFPYVVGEMANGIATAKMVIEAAKNGLLSFFGAAGLTPLAVEKNIKEIKTSLESNKYNWGSNLIHAPSDPQLEDKLVDLYLQHQVNCVSASAYLSLNAPIVRYMCTGLSVDEKGAIRRRNHIFAKISRPEVAKLFMLPPPPKLLNHLLQTGKITPQEAQLATHLPIAEDITVEADSAGHTDNRPLGALLPTIMGLANSIEHRYQFPSSFRIGAAGGLGTPASLAAAFSLGAAYVMTGSVNQCTVESALSSEGKALLAQADIADVAMAPAADMFEFGIKLQVLKRGTLFAAKANKLYDYYIRYPNLDAIPVQEKTKLEQEIFGEKITSIWEYTQRFFAERDPKKLLEAEENPRLKMALIFRWYLGLSSQWAIGGETNRRMDYQIWCSPAMGAFNKWVSGSFLEPLANRTVIQIGRNLLEGAAIIMRVQQMRSYGMQLSTSLFDYRPRCLV